MHLHHLFLLLTPPLLVLSAPEPLPQATNSIPNLAQLSSLESSTSSPITSASGVTITPTDGGSLPTLTDQPGLTQGGLTGLPTLAGQYSYPPASVPPTANAPYMQPSRVPEGTVFIAVGAFLGFGAAVVLGWRMLVAWSLHRSVKRAALLQQMADSKIGGGGGGDFGTAGGMYRYTDRESKISLGGHKAHRGRQTTGAATGGLAPDTTSLFFSPTGAAAAGAGPAASSASVLGNIGNRGSNYLPAGYYASSASAPAGGTGVAYIGGNGAENHSVHSHGHNGNGGGVGAGARESIVMMDLRPVSQGFGYAQVQGQRERNNGSPESVGGSPYPSVNAPRTTTGSRAPSAYFEDLLDESSGGRR